MTILPDGRWALSSSDIANKIWEKLSSNWVLDPDGRHLLPNFPECSHRKLIAVCQPCGRTSALNYHCDKLNTFVSVAYCNVCVSRGQHV